MRTTIGAKQTRERTSITIIGGNIQEERPEETE